VPSVGTSRSPPIGSKGDARMPILRIEHPVPDFDTWKRVFESVETRED
jgi:hypothetical protein